MTALGASSETTTGIRYVDTLSQPGHQAETTRLAKMLLTRRLSSAA